MPDRVVKPGECPDCIMPESAQKADNNWVIAHLERPGPPVSLKIKFIVYYLNILNLF